MHLLCTLSLGMSTALATATGALAGGTLAIYANGEVLATQGFLTPELTRDGWEMRFDHVFVTLADVAAFQTDSPFDAEKGGAPAATTTVGFDDAQHVTIDLTRTDADGRVLVATAAAPEGHYNALAWSVVPATDGPWTGHSMVLIGTATRDGITQPFTLTSTATQSYTCGEYVGDARKGFVAAKGTADLELTFHLDHIFGRRDKAADDAINKAALGFDRFASSAAQVMDLDGLHIGHVGEGHCAVSHR